MTTISNPDPRFHIDMLRTQLRILCIVILRRRKDGVNIDDLNEEKQVLQKLIESK